MDAFERSIINKTNSINQVGKLVVADAGGEIKIYEPILKKGSGYIFQKDDGKFTIKIECSKEDFLYWAWDLDGAKKVLNEKLIEHRN
jgi:hypothetical protein